MTPAVVIVLILGAVIVVLGVLAAVTYLTARGFDAQPVVQLVASLVGAVGGLGAYVNTLVGRRTTTKVERNTGRLATGVGDVVAELDAVRGRHAPDVRGPAPAAPEGDHGQVTAEPWSRGRGPADVTERYADTPDDDLRHTEWYRQR